MHSASGKPGELAFLKQIRSRAAQISHGGLRLGIGDDCALLRVGAGEELAVTTDLAIEGQHFHLAWHSPESIGHRTLARGLSDLADGCAARRSVSIAGPSQRTRPKPEKMA